MSVDDRQASGSEKVVPNEKEKAKTEEVRKLIGPAASKFPQECSDESIIRYLRARNWNTKKAAKMLKETVKWRMKFKPERIQWDDVAHEMSTGKIYRANYVDKYGRPVIVMKPGLQNPNQPLEEQIKCLVFSLENAIANIQKGQEPMDHYPERLGIAVLYNAPKVFESFWLLVKLFLEPKTYKKVKFVYSNQPQSMKIMEALFDMDKLDPAFGGRGKETFDFETYTKHKKDEEKRKFDAKSFRDAQPSNQTSLAPELQESNFLVSDVSSEISNEVDSSGRDETGCDMEDQEEMERHLQIGGKDKRDDKIDCKRKPAAELNGKSTVDNGMTELQQTSGRLQKEQVEIKDNSGAEADYN